MPDQVQGPTNKVSRQQTPQQPSSKVEVKEREPTATEKAIATGLTTPLPPFLRPSPEWSIDPVQHAQYTINLILAEPFTKRGQDPRFDLLILPGPEATQQKILSDAATITDLRLRYLQSKSVSDAASMAFGFKTIDEKVGTLADPYTQSLSAETAYHEARLKVAVQALEGLLVQSGRLGRAEQIQLLPELTEQETTATQEALQALQVVRTISVPTLGSSLSHFWEVKANFTIQEFAEAKERLEALDLVERARAVQNVTAIFFLPKSAEEAEVLQRIRSATPEQAARLREQYADLFFPPADPRSLTEGHEATHDMTQTQVMPIDP